VKINDALPLEAARLSPVVLGWIIFSFLCLYQRFAAGSIRYWSVWSSACAPCAHACVRSHVLKVCERDVLRTACGNFTKYTTSGTVGDKDELVKYWDQKVKGQCHSEKQLHFCGGGTPINGSPSTTQGCRNKF